MARAVTRAVTRSILDQAQGPDMRNSVAFVVGLLASVQGAVAQAPTPFVLGWNYVPDVPQIAVAYERDLWKGQNLAPKLVPFPTGRDTLEALIGGQVDLGVMAEFPPAVAALRNQKFSIVARLSRYDHMRVIAKGAAPLTSLTQLEGKKIGTTIGTNVHFAVAAALAKAGVKAVFVNVGPSDIIPALVRGDVDAASMFPSAYPSAARALGRDYQQILLPDVAQDFLLVASEKTAADPDLIKRALAVILAGGEVVASDPAAAQEATFHFVKSAVPLEQIKAAWGDYSFGTVLGRDTLDLMAHEGEWVRQNGFVKQGTPSMDFYKGFVAPGPLRALKPDRVTLD